MKRSNSYGWLLFQSGFRKCLFGTLFLTFIIFVYPYFVCLCPVSSKFFWEAFVIVMLLLSFKRTTHGYFVKISMTHNKSWSPLLYLFVYCISTRAAPQIMYLRGEYTFRFTNFLIIGLCNSSVNSWLKKKFSFNSCNWRIL